MLIRFVKFLMAPEGAGGAGGAGAGVPAASPAGAANPSPASGAAPAEPRVPFVLPSDDGSDGGAQPGQQPGQAAPAIHPQQGSDNPIPYHRVKEMLQKRDQFYEQKFNELLQRFQAPQRPAPDLKALARALGYEVPEDQPQFVTAADVQRYVDSQLQQTNQQVQQALYLRHEYDAATRDLQSIKAENPQYFEGELGAQVESMLGFLWGAQDDVPMREVGKQFFSILDKLADARNAHYASQKGRDGKTVPIRQAGASVQVTAGNQIDLATAEGVDAALDQLLAQQAG